MLAFAYIHHPAKGVAGRVLWLLSRVSVEDPLGTRKD
jgi:hypothetical protein